MVHLTKRQSNLVRHQGGCHCAAVRFEVLAPPCLTVFECNCSICVKKQIKYFLVPFNQFKLVKGHHSLQTYSFNTHQAKYNFCITCGVQPFHIPSSNPEAYGIAMHCLDVGTVKKVTYEKIDSKKEAQAKRKTSSSDKTSSAAATLGQKTDGKGQDQPLRKTSFIAMLNSWSQGQSTQSSASSYTEEKNHVESAQDSTTQETHRAQSKQGSSPTGTNSTWYAKDSDTTDVNRTRSKQNLATTETANSAHDSTTAEPSSARSTLMPPTTTTIEGKSPKHSAHRRFIVTRVVERSPRSSPCL